MLSDLPMHQIVRQYISEIYRSLLQGFALLVCRLCQFRQLYNNDFGIEGSDHISELLRGFFSVCFDWLQAFGTFVIERYATIPYQAGSMKEVIDHHWLKHIQLEMTR